MKDITVPCTRCEGLGYVEVPDRFHPFTPELATAAECGRCEGAGRVRIPAVETLRPVTPSTEPLPF